METGVEKVYLLDLGWLAGEIGWFLPAAKTYPEKDVAKPEKWVEIPVPAVLVKHKDGNILFDTGCHPEAAKVWPKALFDLFPVTKYTKENRLENQLKLAGLEPKDISAVVFSHLHLDHAGGAYIFKDLKTPLIAHKRELSYALYASWIGKSGAYLPMDLEPTKGAPWICFEGESFEVLPGIDLMLVGGHTPGSIIMRVTTNRGNIYLFTGDFAHLPEEIEMEAKGWLLGNAEEYYTNMRKLKLLAKRPKTHLALSHDPKLWDKYPKAPKYLE
jgi:glyoxylase-like metal-dependent hydrolase (beta-lactamase superfamily II)